MYPSRLEIKRWAIFGGESRTKCDNSRDREATVFIVIINKLLINKPIGQIKNIYYSNPSCRKSFQDRQCNAVHEPLLNIAGIILFYTTQNAKMLHGLGKGGGGGFVLQRPGSVFFPFYSNHKITHHLWNQCNTQIYFSTYIFLFFFYNVWLLYEVVFKSKLYFTQLKNQSLLRGFLFYRQLSMKVIRLRHERWSS